jgi:hypothetical protein
MKILLAVFGSREEHHNLLNSFISNKKALSNFLESAFAFYLLNVNPDFYFFKYSIKKAVLEGSFVFGMS